MSVISSMVVALSADTAKFDRGMRQAQKTLQRMKSSFRSVGTAAAGMGAALTGMASVAVKSFIDVGSAAVDMSARTGLSVEAITALKYAAEQSGTSIDAVEKAFKAMAKNVATGSKEFQRFGIDLNQIRTLSPDQQFLKIAKSIAAMEDPTMRSAAAQKLLGKSGAELLPLLNTGAGGIEAFMQRAQELGLVMSTQTASGAEALGDKLDELKAQFGAMVVQIGSAVAPVLKSVIEYIQGIIPPIIAWIQNNGTLIATLTVVGGVLVTVGTGLVALSTVISALITVCEVAATIFGVVASAIAAIGAPIVLVVAGITALVAWFLAATEAGNGFVAWIWNGLVVAFQAIADTAVWVWSYISVGLSVMWDLMKSFATWFWDTFGFVFEAVGNIILLVFKAIAAWFEFWWGVLKGFADWILDTLGVSWEDMGKAAMLVFQAIGDAIKAIVAPIKWLLQALGLISAKKAEIPTPTEITGGATPSAPDMPKNTQIPGLPTGGQTGADILKSQFGEKAQSNPKKDAEAILKAMDLSNAVSGGPGAKSTTQFTNAADAFKDSFRPVPKAVKQLTDAQKAATKVDLANKAFDLLNATSGGAVSQAAKRGEQSNPIKPPEPPDLTKTTAAIASDSQQFLKDIAAAQGPEQERLKAEKEAQKLRKQQAGYLRDIAKNTSTGVVQLASIGGA